MHYRQVLGVLTYVSKQGNDCETLAFFRFGGCHRSRDVRWHERPRLDCELSQRAVRQEACVGPNLIRSRSPAEVLGMRCGLIALGSSQPDFPYHPQTKTAAMHLVDARHALLAPATSRATFRLKSSNSAGRWVEGFCGFGEVASPRGSDTRVYQYSEINRLYSLYNAIVAKLSLNPSS